MGVDPLGVAQLLRAVAAKVLFLYLAVDVLRYTKVTSFLPQCSHFIINSSYLHDP
jgi:hypothetical protein